MVLDTVITLAIGRNNADGELPEAQWLEFQRLARQVIAGNATVVAATSGAGIASDDDREGKPEDSAVIVAINPTTPELIRAGIAKLLKQFGQSSAALAIDNSHEPVFNTSNGRRATA